MWNVIHGTARRTAVNSPELALFEQNTPGLQLIVKDDKGTEVGAKAATEDAIKGGAELILGPLYSRSTAAMRRSSSTNGSHRRSPGAACGSTTASWSP